MKESFLFATIFLAIAVGSPFIIYIFAKCRKRKHEQVNRVVVVIPPPFQSVPITRGQDCAICLSPIIRGIRLRCGHEFHLESTVDCGGLQTIIQQHGMHSKCPWCRASLYIEI